MRTHHCYLAAVGSNEILNRIPVAAARQASIGDGHIKTCMRAVIDRAEYLLTLARLSVLDWLAGPEPETPADRAIR